MYDFHKATIAGMCIHELLDNSHLNFKQDFDIATAELDERTKRTTYLDIKDFCEVKNNEFANFKFSLHKYFNAGAHNHNDFKISDLLEVLADLSQKFKINPFLTCLHNLEFGVNVALPFKTQSVLKSLINYKGIEPSNEIYAGKGNLLRFKFEQYELKIYDKGRQYKTGQNILRFEIKVRKMQFLKAKGVEISNYADLLKPENISKLAQLLLDAFNEILMCDSRLDFSGVVKRQDREFLLKGVNPRYWDKSNIKSPNTYKKQRSRFRALAQKHGGLHMQGEILELMKEKLKTITEISPATQQAIIGYLSGFSTGTAPKITDILKQADCKTVPEITACFAAVPLGFSTRYYTSNIEENSYLFRFRRIEFGRVEIT